MKSVITISKSWFVVVELISETGSPVLQANIRLDVFEQFILEGQMLEDRKVWYPLYSFLS